MTGWEKKILQIVRKINPDDPIEYVRNIVKDEARKKLDHKLKTCKACEISSSFRTVTYGNTDANILVISDMIYPSMNEKAWDIVVEAFETHQLDITDCFFMNAVNCCPYLTLENDILYRLPNLQEKESCKPYLNRAIEIIKPKFMIILGSVALNSLIKADIDSVHGKVLDIMGVPSIATFSPNYLLRCQEYDLDAYQCEKSIFFKDFERISEEISKEQI